MADKKKISYSIIIESSKSKKLYKKGVRLVEQRKLYNWVDSSSVNNCYICGIIFSMFTRKHHCRLDGRVYCYNCCNKFVHKTKLLGSNLPKPDKGWLNIWDKDYVRLCLNCYQNYKKDEKNKKLFKIFNIIKLNIKDYFSIACVCTKWNNISNKYFSIFRNIQYKLIGDKFTDEEKVIIWNNKQFFKGHSKYLIQLLRITKWDIIIRNKYEEIIEIIKFNKRNSSCWNLMCSRTCSHFFTTFDAFICLSLNKYPYYIEQYLLFSINKANDLELKSYLPNIIFLLRNEQSTSNLIFKFLLKRSQSLYIANNIYWELITQSNSNKIYLRYSKMLLAYLRKIKQNDLTKQIKLVDFFSDVFNNKIIDKYNIDLLNDNLKKDIYIPTPSPTNANFIIQKIKFKNIVIKNSYSKPVIIPTIIKYKSKNYMYKLMYKKDDLRIESIVMNIINLIDIILKKHKINLFITKYNIVPINNKEGFIEIITNSKTLQNIKENNFSIQNYIIENAKNQSIKDIRMKFVKSCAGSCLISYILGLKDRHLENIMLTKNGTLFHIDYAFILGNNPNISTPEIRLTDDMIDGMGGISSIYYKEFQKLCTKSFDILRRHVDLFMVNLSLLYKLNMSNNFSEKYIKEQIVSRLMPNENSKMAKLNFKMKVNKSSTYSYSSYRLIDFFHPVSNDIIYYKIQSKKEIYSINNPYNIENKKKKIKNSIILKSQDHTESLLYDALNKSSNSVFEYIKNISFNN